MFLEFNFFKNSANDNAHSHTFESHMLTLYVVYSVERQIMLQLMSNMLSFLTL